MLAKFSPALAILIGAAMLCATLLLLNLRTTYAINELPQPESASYLRMLNRGCTTLYLQADQPYAVSCPVWVRP